MDKLFAILLLIFLIAGVYVFYWYNPSTESPIVGTQICCNRVEGHLFEPLFAFREISVQALEKMHEEENGPMEYLHKFLSNWCAKHGGGSLELHVCDTDEDGKLELADSFGNPIIFVGSSNKFTMVNKDGLMFQVQINGILPGKSCVLWSLGPNGINEYGLGDDIGWTCWRIEKGEIVEKGSNKVSRIEWKKVKEPNSSNK